MDGFPLAAEKVDSYQLERVKLQQRCSVRPFDTILYI